jgi:hypothetical protein
MGVLNATQLNTVVQSALRRQCAAARSHAAVRTSVREDVAVRHEAGAADDAAGGRKRAVAHGLWDRRFKRISIEAST